MHLSLMIHYWLTLAEDTLAIYKLPSNAFRIKNISSLCFYLNEREFVHKTVLGILLHFVCVCFFEI